jgi:hypothetical protein
MCIYVYHPDKGRSWTFRTRGNFSDVTLTSGQEDPTYIFIRKDKVNCKFLYCGMTNGRNHYICNAVRRNGINVSNVYRVGIKR